METFVDYCMRSSLLSIFAATLVAFNFAFAQSWQNTKGIGIGMSAVKFLGDTPDRAALGQTIHASIKFGPTYFLLFELQGGYGSFKPTIPGSRYKKDANDPYRTFLFPFNLGMKLTPSRSALKPYVIVGGGLLFWDLRNVANSQISFWNDRKWRWGTRISGLRKNLTLHEGLGLEIFPIPTIGLDLQARFTSLLHLRVDNVGYNDKNSQVLEAAATLNFYFGFYQDSDRDGIPDKFDKDPKRPEDFDGFQDDDGVPDPDNDLDGIPDVDDKCPNEPEDIDGFEDQDGCPDLDNDQDGIPDTKEGCPFEPEDMDGFEDEDGCPDIDNDQDGIVDPLDACPDQAEDFDGFEDQDGCPDLDNDKDGIPDALDKCPNQAETYNGYMDDDGCPDEVVMERTAPPEAAGMQIDFKAAGSKFTLPSITFKSGSAILTREARETLIEVYKALKQEPDAMVEIRGFTDSIGDEENNQKLSEKRAQAVLKYLVNLGIPSRQLRAIGMGELDPVASNATPEGRAQNRRIEFLRIK